MRYKFEIECLEKGVIEVEADSFEEAKMKAGECDGDAIWGDCDTEVIKNITK